jgi:hypothetical protein
MMTPRDQIKAVAECRARERECRDVIDRLRREFEETHRAELDELSIGAQSTMEAEVALKQAILAEYEQTGNKHVAPGCGVRETTSYEYANAEALARAKEHGLALALDTKAFRDLCKADSTRPDFVEVKVEPQATIATDLTEAVAEIAVREAA